MRSIQVSSVVYEMLLVISKKRKKRPNEYVEELIEKDYGVK